ncbi:BlaI/MecI/CopY family transcriptional regulator [Balneolaceae bacterium YR4-1]|uniref:BlaI/MecI/CopY family transcriptional regulator n=1 Tax=Halalkalibaculum roseum TaxID=2709311 RepID=A0A6M1SXL5_9BACT|nr:BlaI/MecI/CopY family transcriptional regulator [Halalkalibaculum roseum]NGP75874.1 BlaI/MecI/CopY family transcriptional regulator [Halalkalibaculum roseum]
MKKSLTPLGETEMEVLHHVWEMGEATVKDVKKRIMNDRQVAYTTVMTVMKNLADKGYLKYRKDGVTYVYSPAQEPESVRFNLVKELVKKVFKGSPTELVQTLVEGEELSDTDRSEILKLINNMKEE